MNAIAKLALGLHALCFAACVIAANASGPDEDDPLKAAQQLDQRGLDLEARFYYGKALLRNPRDVAALSGIGLLEVRMGEIDPAHVHLERLQRFCAQCTETARLSRALARRDQVGRADTLRTQR